MHLLKLSLIALTGLCLVSSCGPEEPERKKDLIDPSVVHNPRSAGGIPMTELTQMPVLSFADTIHNFGTVNEGEKLVYEFSFTNTGKMPLLISGASGSCGCTVVDFPREPIAPGKSGSMRTVFSTAGKQGHQEKGITVAANTAKGTQYLYIMADVTPAKN